jgi:DNA-3-methyladenine glycosylase I
MTTLPTFGAPCWRLILKSDDAPSTCGWAKHPLEVAYHDAEWGVPKRGERRLFEDLVLDGAQAGLSWLTILKRREGYRAAFEGFDPVRVAAYGQADIDRLLADPGIIRNRAKVNSAIQNARAFLIVQQEFGTFGEYLWDWVDGRPIQHDRPAHEPCPATSELSDRMSADLKKRGFSFVGSTIVYAMIQAIGLVNDHSVACEQYERVRQLGEQGIFMEHP